MGSIQGGDPYIEFYCDACGKNEYIVAAKTSCQRKILIVLLAPIENSRVNANIVKKCLYLQNRYAEYKRLAHAKDELEKKDIVYDCDEYNTVDDDSDDHDDDDEKPAYKIKTKKDSPQGESALQQEYVDFLIKINNGDVGDYVQKIQKKYQEILCRVEIFLEAEQKKELEKLQTIVQREKTHVLSYKKYWRKLKNHYEVSGVDKFSIMTGCYKDFDVYKILVEKASKNVKSAIESESEEETDNFKRQKVVAEKAPKIVKHIAKRECDRIIEDFEFCVNGKIYASCPGWKLFYRGTMYEKQPNRHGIVYFCAENDPNFFHILYCGGFSGCFPSGYGVLFEKPNTDQLSPEKTQRQQNRIRYIGNFTGTGFFCSYAENERSILICHKDDGSAQISANRYRLGIQQDIEYNGVMFDENSQLENVEINFGEVQGTFTTDPCFTWTGKIDYAVKLLDGILVDLKKEGLEYVGKLQCMKPRGEGALSIKEEQCVLFKGEFNYQYGSDDFTIDELCGKTQAYTNKKRSISVSYFFGLKHSAKDSQGKNIKDVYYFGKVYRGRPCGEGSVHRYLREGTGKNTTYTYIESVEVISETKTKKNLVWI